MSEFQLDRPGLSDYLQMDFARTELIQTLNGASTAYVLGSMALHNSSSQTDAAESEAIQARRLSDENMQLGVEIQVLLEPSFITYYFKNLIAAEVRNAHAQESRVTSLVAPSRLRIDTGLGIFDRVQAPDIEAECIREWFLRSIDRHIKLLKNNHDRDVPVILNASAFADEWRILMDWSQAYLSAFLSDPFIGFDLTELLELSNKVITHDESDKTRWEHTIAALGRIRKQYRNLDSNG
jgi:hypothetical protein